MSTARFTDLPRRKYTHNEISQIVTNIVRNNMQVAGNFAAIAHPCELRTRSGLAGHHPFSRCSAANEEGASAQHYMRAPLIHIVFVKLLRD
jgi:hypothetical protein